METGKGIRKPDDQNFLWKTLPMLLRQQLSAPHTFFQTSPPAPLPHYTAHNSHFFLERCAVQKRRAKKNLKRKHISFSKKKKKKGRKPSCLWLLDQTFMLWVIYPALWKLAPLCLYCTATSPPGADNGRAPKILAAGVQNETLIFTT